ncbi:MAG: NitT/TauT family transport system substrate-binding protein [Actinomycetota bacterium]|nr:NitT/TauT family transport system substrate-binding protein [Actinomycetota bacterium]
MRTRGQLASVGPAGKRECALSLLSLIVVGCASPGPAASPSQAPLTMVRMVTQQSGLPDLAEDVGLVAGIFKRHGIELVLTTIQTGGQSGPNAIAAGDADITLGAVATVVKAQSTGQDLRLFCNDVANNFEVIVVPAASHIPSVGPGVVWQDVVRMLKGVRFGVGNRGSSLETDFRAVASVAGVDPSGITFVPVGQGSAALAAMTNGTVDAMITTPFLEQQATADGRGRVVVGFGTNGPEELRNSFQAGVLAQGDFLAARPQVARSLCDAWGESIAYIQSGEHNNVVKRELEKEFGLTSPVADQVLASHGVLGLIGNLFSKSALTKTLTFLEKVGTIPIGTSINSLIWSSSPVGA